MDGDKQETLTITVEIELLKGFPPGWRERVMRVQLDLTGMPVNRMLERLMNWKEGLSDNPEAVESETNKSERAFLDCFLNLYRDIHRESHSPIFGEPRLIYSSMSTHTFLIPFWDLDFSRMILHTILGASLAAGDSANRARDKLGDLLRRNKVKGVKSYRVLDGAFRSGMFCRQVRGNLYQVGEARNSRTFLHNVSDSISYIGGTIAGDKWSAASKLRAAGYPGATNLKVDSLPEAQKYARKLGYPVVVKPRFGAQGRGVYAGLQNAEELSEYYWMAKQNSDNILIERHVSGCVYRIVVADGQVIKANQRKPGGVTGNGSATIEELLDDLLKTETYRRKQRNKGFATLSLDKEALTMLASQGLDRTSVPKADQFVALRKKANVTAGGTSVDVTDRIHPDNVQLALEVTSLFRLDIVGLDLITRDISMPWYECESLICDVNANPLVGTGKSPEIYVDLLKRMVPNEGRIPILLVIRNRSDSHNEKTSDQIRAHASEKFSHCAMIFEDKIEIKGGSPLISSNDLYSNVSRCISNSSIEAIHVFADFAELKQHGLPVPRVDHVIVECTERENPGELAGYIKSIQSHVSKKVIVTDLLLYRALSASEMENLVLLGDQNLSSLLSF